MQPETMNFDVIVVGAGPAGLSCAIRLKQLCDTAEKPLSICVIEKGAEVGSHILSGAVIEPRALNELFPNWRSLGAPLKTKVTSDHFCLLTQKHYFSLPTPKQMQNSGNYIVSLGEVCRWLSLQAQEMGIEVFSGFAGKEVLYDPSGSVIGVRTGDQGRDKQGHETRRFMRGVDLKAKRVVFAEGCRGELTKTLIEKFMLDKGAEHQTYGIGLKELWEVPESLHQPGKVVHTIGWPLDRKTYGGSFLYHLEHNLIVIGFVVGLDYQNPYLSPFEEFQRFKMHPLFYPLLEKGKRLEYGARALNEGGFQSIPTLEFPGGLIIGDAAGFLNVPKIKGTHTAMKSGMVAAEAIFSEVVENIEVDYKQALQKTWVWDELYRARNIRPAFRYGLWAGLGYAALDTYLLRGKAPWTFKHGAPDHACLQKASTSFKITYRKPDGVVSFDRLSSVYLSGVMHEENQPCHLKLQDTDVPIKVNLALYDAPEQRYCPAGVYEIIQVDGVEKLHINAQNCIHCKTCDIKDPAQNITWVAPEGGGGPNYQKM